MGDYEPYDHREVAKPLTNWEAFVSVLKCAIGTGVLAMPRAFYEVGWISGLFATVIIGIIVVYALHMLIGGMYEMCKRLKVPHITYKDAMITSVLEVPEIYHCFRKILGLFVDITLAMYHWGIMCIYVVFIAFNLKERLDHLGVDISSRLIMVCICLPLIFIFLLRSLKALVIPSIIGNVLLFLGFGAILYFVFTALPPISERTTVKGLGGYPNFFGTVLFAIEAVGVIVMISDDMKHPGDFLGYTGVLNAGMSIVLTLYTFFGFLGYWRYGDEVKGSITLNLDQAKTSTSIIQTGFIIAIYCSYPLQGYVTVNILWKHYIEGWYPDVDQRFEYLLRVLLVISTVIVGIICDNLSGIIALFGSFCLSFVGLIFPALIDLCVKYRDGYGPLRMHLFKNLFIIIFGILGGVMGTISALREIFGTSK